MNSRPTQSLQTTSLIKPFATFLLVSVIFLAMLITIWLGQTFGNISLAQKIQGLFATDSVQLWWYVTRAAGLTGYFLLWLSMVWGLAIPSKIMQSVLDGAYTYDFHEYISLLGLGFVFIHVVVLMFDKYLPFNLIQILVPFTDTYRPFWVGLGIISFYSMLLVTVTFYLRQIIGSRTFRAIHLISLLGYVGATLHGLFAGTDSALPVTMVLYAGTFLITLFLTVYWLAMRTLGNEPSSNNTTQVRTVRQYPRR
jgi:predicted ferric reductase